MLPTHAANQFQDYSLMNHNQFDAKEKRKLFLYMNTNHTLGAKIVLCIPENQSCSHLD